MWRMIPRVLVALSLALVAGCGSPTAAADSPKPGRLVKLPDGRQLNFRCTGSGSPTVLLESGWGAGSTAWVKSQPELSRLTRVCAYDRAGYGFSDPGPLPRDGAAIARDLDQALAAARLRGPYILVGHSAGGLYARLFAARHVKDVQGLILLDPTIERVAPRPAGDGLDGIRRRLTQCLGAAETSPQPPDSAPEWKTCLPANGDPHALALAHRPDIWRQQLSELDEIFGRTSLQVFRLGGLLRPIPMYVVTASGTAESTQQIPGAHLSAAEYAHQLIASQSERGFQQTVLSGHLVMNERPDVVVATVTAMVQAVRGRTPPPPLPRSETAPPEPSPFELPETAAPGSPVPITGPGGGSSN